MRHTLASLALCTALAACAGAGAVDPARDGPGSARAPGGQALTPQAAMDRVVVGKSSKADVSHALGQAITIAFDSGYQVWVYRWAGSDPTTRAATELVLLFDPSGLASKARLRPGYATLR
jgi:hypothetical protein